MDSRQFVDIIRVVVRDSAVSDTLTFLQKPTGRRPDQERLKGSGWYNSLDKDQQGIVANIIKDAVDRAVFGLLCVLDGVRAVEDGPIKGHFELRYVKTNVTVLNAPDGEMLHDIYNGQEEAEFG
jgi:hypothetical protein